MDYLVELNKIEKLLEERKLEHARLTERLANVNKDMDKTKAELKKLGVDEANVADYIVREESNIAKIIAEIKEKLGIK